MKSLTWSIKHNGRPVYQLMLTTSTTAFLFQGTLVPKLTLGPFLTLSVRNGHKLKDWVFGIQAHIQSKSR